MSAPALLQRVADFLRKEELIGSDSLIVVGVSGGVDSMVLLDVLVRLDVSILAAHVNYGLRGAESDADEDLVRHRCANLNVPLESARYETKIVAAERGTSIQETARDLRYGFFAEVAAASGAVAVAVAHHADDQAETVLLNLFRGTGIEGLAGMRPVRELQKGLPVRLIRPLIGERRRAIEAYAREHVVPWREDASNASEDYLRSTVRGELLPRAEEAFGGDVVSRVARTASFVRAYLDESFDRDLEDRFRSCAESTDDGGRLRLTPLREQPDTWRTRVLLEALARWIPSARRDSDVAERIASIIDAQVGKQVPVEGGVVWRERDLLAFVPGAKSVTPAAATEVDLAPGSYPVAGGSLTIRSVDPPFEIPRTDPHAELLDASALVGPLTVRPWASGDELIPIGMTGRKLVSDLLTDARVPSHERDAVTVVESEGVIVWVIGVRLSELVRVRPETTRAWLLTFSASDPNE